MILDFSPRCKMLFTQISPNKRPNNLCKFPDILQTNPLYTAFPLWQYRTKIVQQMRRQVFGEIKGKYARKMCAGRYETGSEGKFASRWRAKSPDALCAVLLYIKGIPADTKKTARVVHTCCWFWSERRESNSQPQLGKLMFCH